MGTSSPTCSVPNRFDILSALDDKIELNRQTNATLEDIAQAIFKEWFVDFNFPGATGELVERAGHDSKGMENWFCRGDIDALDQTGVTGVI